MSARSHEPSGASGVESALAARLLRPDESQALTARGATAAGVLVPIYPVGDELHGVFTRRRDDLRRHAGEISFPGGRRDPEDADLVDTALREAEEEIGLPRDAVAVVGALPPISTFVTDYAVYPFVGVIEAGRVWTPSAAEVAEVLELPLREVRAGHERRRLLRRGVPVRTDTYTVGEAFIWGATARMVAELLARLAPILDGG